MEEPTPMDLDETVPSAPFLFKGMPIDENDPPRVAFRRRYGRLNRLWIDRRTVGSTPPRDGQGSDRWKYDQDDSEDDQDVYEIDPYATTCIKFRATIPLSFGDVNRQRQQWRPSQAQLESAQQAHSQQSQHQALAAAAQAMATQAAAVNGQQSPPQQQSGAAAAAAAAVAAARPTPPVQRQES